MSADDLLDRATRTLRERTGGTSSDAGRTRARVMASVVQGGKRRRLATTILPLAAVLAVSTAWADTHGWLAGVWQRVETSLGSPGGAAPSQGVASVAAPAARAPQPVAAPAASEVPLVAVDSLPRVLGSPTTISAVRVPTSTLSASPAPTTTLEDRVAILYASAHRAHFVDHDPAAALRAWDAYLLAAPDGSFAPEARYNRAITLIRLERRGEARRALAPFADGAYGTYRAREARELLDALRDR